VKLSARNQLRGTVQSVKEGTVMTEIVISIAGGHELVSVITAASARGLGLAPGKEVTVVIKATEVLVASDD
jgi:molybdate transport system regulatory protein